MLKPTFLLTKSIALTVYRKTQGSYVNGDWVEGTEAEIIRTVNIQPLKPNEILMLPEAERTRQWWKVYSDEDLRTDKEGASGYSADEFIYQGERYKIMKVSNYEMGILNHHKALATRIELTPN